MSDIAWVDPSRIGRRAQVVADGDGVEVPSPWNPTGSMLDLANGRRAQRDDRADRGRLPDPPEGELGSAWDRYRIFAYYQDGLIFEQGPIETQDLEDMLAKDGIAQALELVLTLPLRSIDWEIRAADGDRGELDFVKQALETPPEQGGMTSPIHLVLGQMTSGRLFKRAHFERVWRVDDDGSVRYDKLAFRPPSTCYLARSAQDASFQGFMQWTWKGMNFVRVIIPKDRAYVFLHGAHRNPLEGVSDLEVAYNAWQSKQKIRFLWYQFLELQATPRTAATNNTRDQGETNALARKVAGTKGGGVIGLLEGQSLSVLESNGTGAGQFSAAMAYLDQEMLHSNLAGFLGLTSQASGTSGAGGARGSNALSESSQAFFLEFNQGVLREMSRSFTLDAIAPLVAYNFGRDAAVPTLEFGRLEQTDAMDRTLDFLATLVSAQTPTPFLPVEFVDELVERVAAYLDLDGAKVRAAIAAQPKGLAARLAAQGAISPVSAQVHSAVNGATRMVAAAGGPPPGGAGTVAG